MKIISVVMTEESSRAAFFRVEQDTVLFFGSPKRVVWEVVFNKEHYFPRKMGSNDEIWGRDDLKEALILEYEKKTGKKWTGT